MIACTPNIRPTWRSSIGSTPQLDAIAADVAATNDRLEDQLHSLVRTQRTVTRLLERQEERLTQNEARLQASEAMLQILIDMQRHRNGGQTP